MLTRDEFRETLDLLNSWAEGVLAASGDLDDPEARARRKVIVAEVINTLVPAIKMALPAGRARNAASKSGRSAAAAKPAKSAAKAGPRARKASR